MAYTRGLDRYQKEFVLGRRTKGAYLITDEVLQHVQDGIAETKIGILHLFMKHTSAALSLNENVSALAASCPSLRREAIGAES